jgi:hypothetical protein
MNSLKTPLLFFAFVCLLGVSAWSQKSMRDSVISFPSISVVYGGAIPGGDYADRFGYTNTIGAGVGFKFNNGTYLESSVRGITGNEVREEIASNITDLIGTEGQGFTPMALGTDGRYYQVRFWQRGLVIPVTFGYVFPSRRPNPNSGFYVEAGAQFIRHKVRVEVVGNAVPALQDEYKKGYDRLSMGMGIVEGIGYRLHSSNSLLNFIVGVECSQNFTRGMRSYQYDTGLPGTAKRLDLLFGFKAAWIFPIYQSAPDDY